MSNIDFTLIDSLIVDYAHIRKKFELYKKRFPKYISGNDNYIGTIGEYWATRFLENKYSKNCIKSVFDEKENGIHNLSNEWSDFKLEHDDEIIEYISVKAIFESKSGESGEIKYKSFQENEIGSVLIVKLDDYLFPVEILYINDLASNNRFTNGEKNYKDNWINKKPLLFKFYNSSKSYGFDRKLSSLIYTFDKDNENFIPLTQ